MPRTRTFELRPTRASAPKPSSFDDEAEVVEFERATRRYRALTEPFWLEVGEGTEPIVVRGESGGAYVVELFGQLSDPSHEASCTCPDFSFNRLGTCKHIEVVRRWAEGSRTKKERLAANKDKVDNEVVVFARADHDLRLAALGKGAIALLRELGVRCSDYGDVEPGDVVGLRPESSTVKRRTLRVTHGAVMAARILDAQAKQGERSRAIAEVLQSGTLGVDVLSVPLFPYQRDGVAHLVSGGRAVLADDMGLGKTVQTIAACEVLRRRGEAKRILVVCPASLKAQWAREIARYAGERAIVVTGSVEQRRAAMLSDAPYIILNYELTLRDLGAIRELSADVLILDEAQRAKNFRTKTAANLRAIPSRFLFVLTGTPIENRLDDLYSILQIVDPSVLGPLWKFNVDFHTRDARGKIVGYRNLGELRRRISSVVLRRRKESVLAQLPPLTEQTRYVPLTERQLELDEQYRLAAAKLMRLADKRPLTIQEMQRVNGALLKARQACNAAKLCDPEIDEEPGKLDELVLLVSEIAAQGNSKAIVFSEWTEMLELAAARLTKEGIGHLVLHGGVPVPARARLLDRFREDASATVLLSTDAGGVGLNLQVASYVIHLDLPWNPARADQRTARAHRLGQTRGVSVTYLCAESGIERGIEGTLAGKRAVRAAAIDATSDVDALDAPTFIQSLARMREVLADASASGGVSVAVPPTERSPGQKVADAAPTSPSLVAAADDDDRSDETATLARPAEDSKTRELPAVRDAAENGETNGTVAAEVSAGTGRGQANALPVVGSVNRASMTFARQRMRLAEVVLGAGFPADAVRAAYEAVAASVRSLAKEPIAEGHVALVAAIYGALLPSGLLPSTIPGLVARVNDLALLEDHGVPVDAAIAAAAVADVKEWLDRVEKNADGSGKGDLGPKGLVSGPETGNFAE